MSWRITDRKQKYTSVCFDVDAVLSVVWNQLPLFSGRNSEQLCLFGRCVLWYADDEQGVWRSGGKEGGQRGRAVQHWSGLQVFAVQVSSGTTSVSFSPRIVIFHLGYVGVDCFMYRISRTLRRTFFPEKCDLKSTCILDAEGKYLFPNLWMSLHQLYDTFIVR